MATLSESESKSKANLAKLAEELTERLERIRRVKGMSKERFANAILGVSSPTYYRWVEQKLMQLPLWKVHELQEVVGRLERELGLEPEPEGE